MSPFPFTKQPTDVQLHAPVAATYPYHNAFSELQDLPASPTCQPAEISSQPATSILNLVNMKACILLWCRDICLHVKEFKFNRLNSNMETFS